jgi:hypothetical protein
MMKFNEDYFYTESVLQQLSMKSGQPVMYARADGPNTVTDPAELEEIWGFYLGKCPLEILNALRSKGEVYCYFRTQTAADNAFHEWFPQKNQLLDEEMGYYIYANVINASEGVNNVNG